MTKTEFLQGLREALESEDAPENVLYENYNYYNHYIEEEQAKGRTLEEIMEELGDPRLIARSILDAMEGNTDADESTVSFDSFRKESSQRTDAHTGREQAGTAREQNYNSSYDSYGSDDGQTVEDDRRTEKIHTIDFSKWYVKLLAGLIAVLAVLLIFAILFGALALVFKILTSPVFWIIIAASWLIGWLTRGLY